MNLLIIILISVVLSALVTVALVFGWDMSLKAVATDVGLAAAIITAAGIVWQKGIRPFFFHVQHVNRLLGDVGEIARQHREVDLTALASAVEEIKHDLRPNAGGSLRDSVDRIETCTVRVERINWAIRQDGPVGIFICDREGRNTDVNRTYCRWLGVGSDELLGHGWRRFLAADSDREHYDAEWKLAFEQGREGELCVNLKSVNGSVAKYHVHAYPLQGHNGETREYLGVIRKAE